MKYPFRVTSPNHGAVFLRPIVTRVILLFLILSAPVQADIFQTIPASGSIEVTLHPGETVEVGETAVVAFGVPFPRSLVSDVNQIKVTDLAGNDIASDIRETMRWHSLLGDSAVGGLRSVVILLETTFDSGKSKQVQVVYGQGAGVDWTGPSNVRETWVSTLQGEPDVYPDNEGLFEPAVYATLPPSWMAKSVIRTPFVPKERISPEFQWHLDAMESFGRTSVEEIGEAFSAGQFLPVPITTRGVWLFDRPGVYWDTYYRTGELYWLRAAHKASQFYAGRIDESGIFELAGWEDPKYSFSGGLIGDLIMTGDTSLEDVIRRIARFHQEDHDYFLTSISAPSGWNERWYTYWLLGALSAFELTGEERYRTDAIARAEHLFERAQFPVGGWSAEGGILHSKVQHDGGGGSLYQQEPVISPWMSALLADAVWRYYIHSEDANALQFLANLADSVVEHALYISRLDGVDYVVPRYLSSGQINPEVYNVSGFGDQFTDSEHALDVAGLIARGYWAKRKLGRTDTASLLQAIDDLKPTIDYTFNKWTRLRGTPAQITYVLRPPRSFNWWFGTTSDFEWLLTVNPEDATPPPETVLSPEYLQVEVLANQSVGLSWNDRADNEAAYLVERNSDGGDYVQVAELPSNSEAFNDSNVSSGVSYAYRVRAQSDTGQFSSYSNTVEIVLDDDGDGNPDDQQNLATPTELTATAPDGARVELSWKDNSLNETHVEVQRSVNGGPFRWLDRIGANTTSYQDNNVQPNTSYVYRVRAIIFQVETSDYSIPATVTTPMLGGDQTVPNAPSNLVGNGVTDSSVTLVWQDNSDDETSFVIERSLAGQVFTVLVELPEGSVSHVDQSLLPSTAYFYRVKARKGQLESLASNTLEIVSDAALPPLATPTGLTARSTISGSISLSWNDVSSAETHFEIQRSVSGGPFRWHARLASGTTEFTDKGVSIGVTYAYRIRAIDFQKGATLYSQPVTVVAAQAPANSLVAVTMMLLED